VTLSSFSHRGVDSLCNGLPFIHFSLPQVDQFTYTGAGVCKGSLSQACWRALSSRSAGWRNCSSLFQAGGARQGIGHGGWAGRSEV
jgi:hypothetical protein